MDQIKNFFGGDAQNSPLPMLFMFGLMFAIIYFIMIRPQQKQQKRHQDLLASLKKGDEVILSSGIVGRIFAIEDRFLTLEIGMADKIKMRVVRQAVQGLMGSSSNLATTDENK